MNFFDLKDFLQSFGLIGIFLMLFAECGLLVGFFLPGDSLLFTAGLLSQQKVLPALPLLLVVCFAGAVLGDQTGYFIGRRFGPAIFRRPDSRLFKKENVERSQAFFAKHGAKTIILARFVPIVRTFTPVVAGVGRMQYRTYLIFDLIGGLLWAVGIASLGFVLGKHIPNIDKYLLPAILVIVALSFVPVILELWKGRRHQSQVSSETDSSTL